MVLSLSLAIQICQPAPRLHHKHTKKPISDELKIKTATSKNKTPKQKIMGTFLKAVSFLTNNIELVEVLIAGETLLMLLSNRSMFESPLTRAICYSSISMKKHFFFPSLQNKTGHHKCFTLREAGLDLPFH